MKIDSEMVRHIAGLARLELSEAEVEMFTTQLTAIVEYVDKLKEVEGPAEPFSFSSFMQLPMRDDTVLPSLRIERSLQNAPDQEKNLFRVPKILP